MVRRLLIAVPAVSVPVCQADICNSFPVFVTKLPDFWFSQRHRGAMFYWGWTSGMDRNSAVHNGRNNVFVVALYVIYGCCRYNSSVEGPLLLQHSACVPLNCLCPSENCSYETGFSGDYDHLGNENGLSWICGWEQPFCKLGLGWF